MQITDYTFRLVILRLSNGRYYRKDTEGGVASAHDADDLSRLTKGTQTWLLRRHGGELLDLRLKATGVDVTTQADLPEPLNAR